MIFKKLIYMNRHIFCGTILSKNRTKGVKELEDKIKAIENNFKPPPSAPYN